MNITKLIPESGGIYTNFKNKTICVWDKTDSSCYIGIDVEKNYIFCKGAGNFQRFENMRVSTQDEIIWIKECINQNKFVSMDEALFYYNSNVDIKEINNLKNEFNSLLI